MSYKDLTLLVKKLFSLVMVAALAVGMITVPAQAAESNGQSTFNEIENVELLGINEGYTFYEGVNDDCYIASGSMIRITYKDGRGDTLKIQSGAFVESENPKNMKLRSKNGKATITLNMSSQNVVSFTYQAKRTDSESTYQYSQNLLTRRVAKVEDMPALQKGSIAINSESATTKYFKIDADSFIGNADSAYFNSYTLGSVDTVLFLYEYTTEDGTAKWKQINSDDDDGSGYNASMFYKIEKGQKYVLAVRSWRNATVLVTELLTQDSNLISGVSDLGTVYYPQFGTGNIHVQYIYVDGRTKEVKVLHDWNELQLYIGHYDNGYALYSDNENMLADGTDIFPLALKPENVIEFSDFSEVPAYQLGRTITIPANSFQVYSIDVPEHFNVKFDNQIEAKIYHGYNEAEEEDEAMWIDYDPEEDDDNTGISYTANEDVINKKCLIGFYNDSRKDITGRIIKTEGEYAEIEPDTVTLNKTSLILNTGESAALSATVLPENADDKSIVWSSSNPSVATVDGSGKVTAVTAGTAIITAKTVNGKTAACNVTVNAANNNSNQGNNGQNNNSQGNNGQGNSGQKNNPAPKDPAVGSRVTAGGQIFKVDKGQKVTFAQAKNANKVVVPETITINGKKYTVTSIGANAFKKSKAKEAVIEKNVSKIAAKAFKGSKVKTIIVKTKKLKAKSVKGSLKGSKVKTVKVKVGKKKENTKYVKKYKKIFTAKNAGKKVKVK